MMQEILLAGIEPKVLYAVPLVVAISLVYGATRHEFVPHILKQSLKAGLWVVMFMTIILVLIVVADRFV